MSFNPIMFNYISYLMRGTETGGSVVELGNQTVNLDGFGGVPKDWDGQSAERVYRELLKFDEYRCVDTNGSHSAIKYDINNYCRDVKFNPAKVPSELRQQYDLVTDNGTGEHIFDQKCVFTLMHDLCKVGGLMVHVLPFLNWINHGFYCFQPLAFRDIAYANGYVIADISVANRWGDFRSIPGEWHVKQLKASSDQLKNEMGAAIQSVARLEQKKTGSHFPNIIVCAALIRSSPQPFRTPFQGKYIKLIHDEQTKEGYVA